MTILPSEVQWRVFDLCIVGSGPAGMAVALEHAALRPSSDILLVEFGDDKPSGKNALDDAIEIRNLTNHHGPYECTNKGFGGTSATWGGRCVMYDEVDFIPRPVIGSNCTWDRSLLDELQPYIRKASELLECGRGPFDLAADELMAGTRIAEGFVPGEVTDTVVERWSMPTRFAGRYGRQIKESPAIHLLQGWRARRFGSVDVDGAVQDVELEAKDSTGRLKIQARQFVLAAGAQEVTRLLLQNKQLFAREGGAPDALGRYYQCHLSGKIASVQFSGAPEKTDYGFIRESDGTYIRRRFQFPAEVLCRENLLNTALWLDNPLYVDPEHRSGAMSFMYLAMITPVLGPRLAPPAIARTITKGKIHRVPAHVVNILKDLPESLWTPASIFFQRYCRKRKLPGVFLYSPENKYALHFHAEQIPSRENRMELAPDGETLVIHYNLMQADIDSVIRCHELLDHWLRECRCGHLEYWFPQEQLAEVIREMSKDGIHQCGTTRIGRSVADGVVDSDLRVFGTSNVFVCSSSVFPTSGQANPTFLTCVFAARLAQKLALDEIR
jgi:hypothetical protein